MITFNQLRVGYRGKAVTPAINGTLACGSMTALVGANGSGKSTLLKTLAGAIPPVSGSISRPNPAMRFAWLPQQADIEKQFPISVFDIVAMGCWPRTGWLRAVSRQQRNEIMQALETVGMADFAKAQPGTLSGGQLQRVLFARMLMQQAQLLLLDEPFSGIDEKTVTLLLSLLHQRHQAGCTLVVVLHDSQTVARHFMQVLRIGAETVSWEKGEATVVPLPVTRRGGTSC
ncbi:ABC transporter ATP-binding protein [Erwinia sp. OLTSP20]|uniref:metal ABC transporter ATP-binding protein n=1 Tax=unclassified Erwinia TaxID=2622719 RepID=UPI000C1787D6|nr:MULTISPECIES: ATP-binding cassette domain-containing protein [unclassified Erwinia]PIJ50607.1 ABC transporter ATP-binding protein [Erwinia sp. OAMSP11]PIJ72654.1 ABC transporter ATP-binding protein [Erwinia sp. OLSSP12]PIJ83263.1 ABC transporter ATP-binding protein [Erwinia sp. OLCASP19]PIJ85235.1 ABC transporter ATP-binding protein [Erwinia sp. OLMTSP26]PIJ87238.1 ABC transporter ATP-binding protein [Erwinia sp. OLMDSP33]